MMNFVVQIAWVLKSSSRLQFWVQVFVTKYSDAYKLVKGNIKINGAGAYASSERADKRNKQVTFKNYAPFTDCISEINNTLVHNTKELDVVSLMYNIIEYSNNYAKRRGSLKQ